MAVPNLTNYNIKKIKGLISIQKVDDKNYAIGTKQFDPDDGTELPMQVIGVTITEVDKAIVDKQKELTELTDFEKDLIAVV
ncbi:MAG: hypothetical protein LAN71_17755 [Acidobacteriia bacterium]|nr:hypothetical protein [Terriglobia bacterium]